MAGRLGLRVCVVFRSEYDEASGVRCMCGLGVLVIARDWKVRLKGFSFCERFLGLLVVCFLLWLFFGGRVSLESDCGEWSEFVWEDELEE